MIPPFVPISPLRSHTPLLTPLIAFALFAVAFVVHGVNASAGNRTSVTYTQGTLHVNIPYNEGKPGSGRLVLEVLDPEDGVIGRVERAASISKPGGMWQASIKLDRPKPADELVWHRLRYRFTFDNASIAAVEGIESISNVLRRPVVHVRAQQAYASGGQAAVRVVVTDSNNEIVSGKGTVRVEFGDKRQMLFQGTLNQRGTVEAQFRFPAGITGNHTLRYSVDTAIGSTEAIQQVRLEERTQILLSTEKPIYQPGQRIHVRALALDRTRHEAAAARALTFELEDSRGNKVMKKTTQTSPFGVASVEFPLADEVNLGTYHLRAVQGGEGAGAKAEIAINVEKYVLPRFKVAVEFTGKSTHGYRPGGRVTGTVRANYFFGKPVEGEVSVKLLGADVDTFVASRMQGKTDAEGAWRFDVKLPDYFAGRPLSQGAARVLVEATVKDSAGHSESRGEPITVSESPLIITAVPEGGSLIPGLENQVFILTAYADGKPARTTLRVRADGNGEQTVSSDDGGIAIVRLKPTGDRIQVDAVDKDANRGSAKLTLQSRSGNDQILLRTDKAVFRAGDRMHFRVFSTRNSGAAYIDVIKDGQTVLTRDVDIVNGQADLELTATPALAGTVDVNAYLFGRDAIPVADHRLLFVQPADELKIETTSDKPVYKPGEEARVRFKVTNSRGEGVQAALGLQVVDEAVFALAEKQPGFAKVFFYLEQEAMKPRYEIHSVGLPEVLTQRGEDDRQARAARVLFAATELVNRNSFTTEAGRALPLAQEGQYRMRYQKRFADTVLKNAESLARVYDANRGDLAKAKLRDCWNNGVTIQNVYGNQFLFQSAGFDKKLRTQDDLMVYAQVKTKKPAKQQPHIEVIMEPDRGPFNGRAEITGLVNSPGPVTGISIVVRERTSRATYSTRPATSGTFTFSALPPGDYVLEVHDASLPSQRGVTLAARDKAVVIVTLAPDQFDRIAIVEQASFDRNIRFMRANRMADGVAGGVIGGVIGAVPAAAPPPPMELFMAKSELRREAKAKLTEAESGASEPRVRSYFPEALYINPQILTDDKGEASVVIPMADSITTWRMALLASTRRGALGSATGSIKVFQDFFVDLDLPVTLTQGDRVSIPVAAYNYSGTGGSVNLQLQPADWFSLAGDSANKTLAVDSGRVGGTQFTVEARRIGKFQLKLAAKMTGRADIVVREIEVVPNGREQTSVINGRLESIENHEVVFPPEAIADASKLFVRLYPGPLSQVVEGMDAILRMPYGCFEQTSSSTYPNILALDYMKRSKKLTPEVRAKAEGFITTGYQRLLTFEVPGGGFSWFGNAPANKILTSYGLMEFFDMLKVHEVDPRLIARTQDWLAAQQQADGSWAPDQAFINEGATNRYNSNLVRITAYIAWALGNTQYNGPAVEKAKQYVERNMTGKLDTYTLAVIANFAADYGRDRSFTQRAIAMLSEARTEQNDKAWWNAEETAVFATGQSAAIETTGLAVQALLNSGLEPALARKALAYLASKKDASGTWGTTQATIMALRALLLSMDKGAADVRGKVEISLNGQAMETLTLTAENNDLFHQIAVKGIHSPGANRIGLRFHGKGSMAFQLMGRYFLPWDKRPEREALSIDVSYDRTTLAQDDIATATATAKNNLPGAANMVMIDLGIPPGFDLPSEDLQAMQQRTANQKGGRLEKFSQTATQAILYFDSIPAGGSVTVKYRLRAKYPLRARTPQSKVYAYYDPAVQSIARPVALEVRKK
ncbi:MAG: carboxypeptidase regulatory-like domain-containing protein [Acidobacteria bacterium]|nr:carboxypeptidase regulatory-like domain-containing protein [Acidobacteriota bacterium]